MTSTTELRSIYSGPIRRALERMEKQIAEGGNGGGTNEVTIGGPAPTDTSELWVDAVPSIRAKIAGVWTPVSGPQGPQGAQGPTGPQGTTGPQGPQGIQGPQGPVGSSTSMFEYHFNTTTTPPPASGTVRKNNASAVAATTVWVHRTDAGGTDRKPLLMRAKTDTDLYIQDVNNADAFIAYTLTADAIDNGDYITMPVALDTVGTVGIAGGNRVLVGVVVTGEQGPPGPQGPPGVQGPVGATGATGAQGAQGPKGDTGATGASGPMGGTGPQGPTGLQGDPGPQGPAGADSTVPGPPGATGSQGPQGPQGVKGDTGTTGATGSQGPPGAQGLPGPEGPQGDPGAPGVQGPKGDTGATGSQGVPGTPGTQGPKGDTGAQGPQGIQGPVGPEGPEGDPGPQGPPGLGLDEVWIGPSDPIATVPSADLWYDTDAPTYDVSAANPQNALGVVAMGSFPATAYTLTTSFTAVTNALPVTLLVGRRYRIIFMVRAAGGASPNYSQWTIYDNGASLVNVLGDRYVWLQGQWNVVYCEWLVSGDGAAHSFDVRGTSPVSMTVHRDINPSFYVEDIGPNASPALPIPVTPPAWTPLSYNAGWANLGAGTAPLQYRKVGDNVTVRGVCRYTTGGNPMATLPVGFRPAYINGYPALTRDATPRPVEVRVGTNGGMDVLGMVGACDFSYEFTFSVTP